MALHGVYHATPRDARAPRDEECVPAPLPPKGGDRFLRGALQRDKPIATGLGSPLAVVRSGGQITCLASPPQQASTRPARRRNGGTCAPHQPRGGCQPCEAGDWRHRGGLRPHEQPVQRGGWPPRGRVQSARRNQGNGEEQGRTAHAHTRMRALLRQWPARGRRPLAASARGPAMPRTPLSARGPQPPRRCPTHLRAGVPGGHAPDGSVV
jgi:hypothetical protein